jgi:hypothetical protein
MALGQHRFENPYGARDLDFDDLTLDIEPADRVGPPLPSRYKAALRRMLAGVLLLAATWAVIASGHGPQVVASAKSLLDGAISQAQEIASRADQEQASVGAADASSGPAEPVAPIEQNSVAELPHELAPAQDEKAAPAAGEALPTEAIGATYSETPEPAEDAEAKSPKRKTAIAAGLGPDLPNVLLTRLSDVDLKNAGYAIKTALAKTPDNASFAWPPAPSQQQALFEVRFVPGAAEGCRRYIVTVTKARWSSTSAALEKCADAVPHDG